jgi:hypothetical protein
MVVKFLRQHKRRSCRWRTTFHRLFRLQAHPVRHSGPFRLKLAEDTLIGRIEHIKQVIAQP